MWQRSSLGSHRQEDLFCGLRPELSCSASFLLFLGRRRTVCASGRSLLSLSGQAPETI